MKKNLNNDVAIIVMQEEFILSHHVGTICLPNQDDYSNINWKNCYATGWGKDQWGKSGKYQVVMKQIQMDMVDHKTCENKLRYVLYHVIKYKCTANVDNFGNMLLPN